MRPRVIGVVASLAAWTTAGCGVIVGNESEATETRAVEGFSRVDARNGVLVELSVDPAQVGQVDLEVTAESNLLEHVRTDVGNSTLTVSVRGNVEAHLPIAVVGTSGDIASVEATNGASVTVYGISESALALTAVDGGAVTTRGTAGQIRVTATDGGSIDAPQLTAEIADVDLDSGSSATICATGEVSGTVTNGSTLTVQCGGDTTGVSTSTGGSVQ